MHFTQRGLVVIVLLCGGDKRTQSADIKRAVLIAKDWEQ
jgi:putative addiction module killer protein